MGIGRIRESIISVVHTTLWLNTLIRPLVSESVERDLKLLRVEPM